APIATAADGRSTVVLLGSGRRPLVGPVTETIALELGTGTATGAVSIVQANVAPEQFAASLAGHFDAAARARLLERAIARVVRAAGTLADAAGALGALHDATRERLPAPAGGPAAASGAHVEGFWRVDGS